MKKILKISLLCVGILALLILSANAQGFSLTSEIPAEINLYDAVCEPFSVSGNYNPNVQVSLEIRNSDTGKVVLYLQTVTDENGDFEFSGTMSDEVEVGAYNVKIGATAMINAADYVFETVRINDEALIHVFVAGGSATVNVNGENRGEAPFTASYKVGDKLIYTAQPDDESKEFLYWTYQNDGAGSEMIISEEEILEVTVGSNATYTAMYVDADTTESYFVVFKSNKRVLAANLSTSITIPADPYMPGFVFDGWYNEDGEKTVPTLDVNRNTTYVAGFKADAAEYDVIIEGANEESGKYKYNEKAEVTAKGEDGKVFSHWTRDGKTVSYNETYIFYVSGNTTVKAVYADEKAEAQVVLVMAEPVIVGENLDKIAFYAERSVPDNYTMLETGILMSQAENFDVNTSGIIKARASWSTPSGQFTVRKGNAKGQTWYAKAYLIYSDGNEVYTVYSNRVSKSV